MGKRIIIREEQLRSLVGHIRESNDHTAMVKNIQDDLEKNYAPEVITQRQGGEYFETPSFRIKADGSMTTGVNLLRYLSMKYGDLVGDDFIKQVIRDWADESIDDGYLSKNVSMS